MILIEIMCVHFYLFSYFFTGISISPKINLANILLAAFSADKTLRVVANRLGKKMSTPGVVWRLN